MDDQTADAYASSRRAASRRSPLLTMLYVLTLMSNVIVSVPLPVVRPYASAGVGLMRTHVGFSSASLANVDDNLLGYDIGGGVMVLLPHHLGVKGDFRYLRSAKSLTVSGIVLNNTQLNFSRASIALVLH